MQYFGYLRRKPNDPQDTDFTGYDFWLTKLNEFNGNFINAEMVKAFIVLANIANDSGRSLTLAHFMKSNASHSEKIVGQMATDSPSVTARFDFD